MSKTHPISLLPLLLVIFVDILGASFIIPLLGPLLIDKPTSILPLYAQYDTRTFYYGLTLGIYSIATFFGAPILGDLSDKVGRKKMLLICLIGALIGYVVSAIGIVIHSVFLLVMGRMIAGFTAGSLSVAQACILDVSTPITKTKNIGYMLFAISLGYILGPLGAGILSDSKWVSWFELTTPVYFGSIILIFNIIFLFFAFKENYVPRKVKSMHWLAGLTVVVSAFKIPKIRTLMFIFLFLQIGWATFIQFIGLFLTLKYHFTSNEVGLFLGCMGVGFFLAFIYLLNIITQHFPFPKITVAAISIIALCFLAILAIENEWSVWALSIPAAMALGIAFSVLTSLFSEQVEKDKQGWIMGLMGAIAAFSFGITGLMAGMIVDLGLTIPIWFAFICVTISALIAYGSIYKKYKPLTSS